MDTPVVPSCRRRNTTLLLVGLVLLALVGGLAGCASDSHTARGAARGAGTGAIAGAVGGW